MLQTLYIHIRAYSHILARIRAYSRILIIIFMYIYNFVKAAATHKMGADFGPPLGIPFCALLPPLQNYNSA